MAKKNLKYQSPGINEETRFEKLHTVNFESSQEASSLIAREICDLVKSKQEKNKSCVIGFATGSSPSIVYQEIIIKAKKLYIFFIPFLVTFKPLASQSQVFEVNPSLLSSTFLIFVRAVLGSSSLNSIKRGTIKYGIFSTQ